MKVQKNIIQKVVVVTVGVVVVVLGSLYYLHQKTTNEAITNRDSVRISDLHQIRYALDQYRSEYGVYPLCIYKTDGCRTTLEGSKILEQAPKDPLTNLNYSYAANGSGNNCKGFHLGASLENNHSPFMVLGSDAPVRPICTGSLPDFTGLSFASGGQPCNTSEGVAQPTDDPKGESCYDLTR